MLKHELAGGHVLDFGCGPGFLSERLLDGGFEVTAVDQSPGSVDAANRRCGGRHGWHGAALGSDGLPSASFDGAMCIETIEHLDDDGLSAVLEEIDRVLRPSGIAVFTTPNEEDLRASMVYCPFCDTEFHPVQHVRSWSAASLEEALLAAGFDVLLSASTDLARWQPVRHSAWMGRPGQASLLVKRLGRRPAFGSGPHLVALAQSRSGG